jgi:hypothetical protein
MVTEVGLIVLNSTRIIRCFGYCVNGNNIPNRCIHMIKPISLSLLVLILLSSPFWQMLVKQINNAFTVVGNLHQDTAKSRHTHQFYFELALIYKKSSAVTFVFDFSTVYRQYQIMMCFPPPPPIPVECKSGKN